MNWCAYRCTAIPVLQHRVVEMRNGSETLQIVAAQWQRWLELSLGLRLLRLRVLVLNRGEPSLEASIGVVRTASSAFAVIL